MRLGWVICLIALETAASAQPPDQALEKKYLRLYRATTEQSKTGIESEEVARAAKDLCQPVRRALAGQADPVSALLNWDRDLCYPALGGDDGCEHGRPYWARVLLRWAIAKHCDVANK